MKKFLLGSVGLAAMLAGPAMAADMPVVAPPPPPVVYDWTGAYVGFNVGGAWYDVDRHFPVGPTPAFPTAPDFSTSDSDGIYGFHAGAPGDAPPACIISAVTPARSATRETSSPSGGSDGSTPSLPSG